MQSSHFHVFSSLFLSYFIYLLCMCKYKIRLHKMFSVNRNHFFLQLISTLSLLMKMYSQRCSHMGANIWFSTFYCVLILLSAKLTGSYNNYYNSLFQGTLFCDMIYTFKSYLLSSVFVSFVFIVLWFTYLMSVIE